MIGYELITPCRNCKACGYLCEGLYYPVTIDSCSNCDYAMIECKKRIAEQDV